MKSDIHTNQKDGNMNEKMLEKYAQLLVDYSLYIKENEKLFIRSSTLAEPLVKKVYQKCIDRGAIVEIEFELEDQASYLLANGNSDQLSHVPTLRKKAMEEYDAYLAIRAPQTLKIKADINPEHRKLRTAALIGIQQTYFDRTANGSLKRSLCQYPTLASANAANMTLEEYSDFICNACKLDAEDPKAEWIKLSKMQQHIVDYLNKADVVQYKSPVTDISFSVKDRIWINSDGKTNMPSGEVFTGPIEDSVNGVVHFDYPSIYMGKAVEAITLEVKDGEVIHWDAKIGKEVLDEVFNIPGARFFGEVAIGTNYGIQRATKNILFDEKIGGTIHMAVGQSYKQTGAKNKSSVHWDMISDMKNGGHILVDGNKIYENGKFLI